MKQKTLSYFRPDGSYAGTYLLFEPEGDEKLHADGISIVRPDGSVFKQANPHAGLPEVEGKFNGAWRYRNGAPEAIPESEKPIVKTEREEIAELKTRLDAIERGEIRA